MQGRRIWCSSPGSGDPAFDRPTNPIGPLYEEAAARRLEADYGWTVIREQDRYRRAVPSPRPKRILELDTIMLLVRAGVIVVCTGGGGIPIVGEPSGAISGVEAVIDKDRASVLLAVGLGAQFVLFLTDVCGVYESFPSPQGKPIRRAAPAIMSALSLDSSSPNP